MSVSSDQNNVPGKRRSLSLSAIASSAGDNEVC